MGYGAFPQEGEHEILLEAPVCVLDIRLLSLDMFVCEIHTHSIGVPS